MVAMAPRLQSIPYEKMQHTKSLDLNKILQVAESLENIVSQSFGPEGRHVLLIKSTGELLITKDGRKTLECLLMDHPVARMIVTSASKHYSITGDGVKSFVLLLCAFLRELQRAVDKNEGLDLPGNSAVKQRYKSKCHALRRISGTLLTFQSTVLEHIIAECLSPHFLSIYSDVKGNMTLCRTCLQQTLDAYFCGRNVCSSQGFISRLACDYIYKCLVCVHAVVEAVKFVERFFSELHIEVPGFPVDNSRILPGLILHQEFSVYCPAEGELRALIVTDQIHQLLCEPGIGFAVSSETQLQDSQQYLEQRTQQIMKHVHNNQIKLILSSVKQHQIVIFNAKLHGISVVDCLSSEEIELLCSLTGVSPVSSPFPNSLQSHSFTAKGCQPVILGSKKYVQLVLNGSGKFKPHSLVLYGPIKGLTEQIASAFDGAFKMLRQLLKQVDASWERPLNYLYSCLPNRCVSEQVPSTHCSTDQSNEESQGYHQQEVALCTHMRGQGKASNGMSEWSEGQHSGTLNACPQMCRLTYAAQEETAPEMCEELPVDMLKSSFHPESGNGSLMMSSSHIGVVMPAGGAFEMLLHHHLHNFAKGCQNSEISIICTTFGDALLCIPRLIYQSGNKKTCFPIVHIKYLSALKNKEPVDMTKTGLESVSCKYQLIASVLQCISKLLTIDLIVGIKRGPHSVDSEGTEED